MTDKTVSRKADHIEVTLKEDVERGWSGLSEVRFVHEAITLLDWEDIDLRTKFINHDVSAPLMITAMTGGYPEAENINRRLAKVCQDKGIAMGLGSQRAMLKRPEMVKTYRVRDVAPDIPLVGNIGFAQLREYDDRTIEGMLRDVDADYLAVHLNTLQEIVQPEGDRDFKGSLERLRDLSQDLSLPIIVKETGAGLMGRSLDLLKEVSIRNVDVAGLGGTSWAEVERHRGGEVRGFADWGNPTALCVVEAHKKGFFVVGSGGVRSGLDAAKVLALGADVAGAALPFLRNLDRLEAYVDEWITDIKRVCMLTNAKDVSDLRTRPLLITGRLAEVLRLRGHDPEGFAQR